MLPHLDGHGAGLLRPPARPLPRDHRRTRRPAGGPHRPPGLRPRLRRHGQLGVQHRLRQHPDRGDAYVTRLTDLRAAEDFIAAGVPLVASIAFGRGQLSGAPISSSAGHLLVVVGFERDGDVIVNDPAAASNSAVRRVYDRDQFEDVWINASGGVVYVINR
ncbi:hypothetical protein G7071_07570 [Nocardioides piscis]|uniref:Peptidase C39-like domain-containing protein n=1 Tax=Nocardioides piscis TaxID=2714938 RepID=A0A6G7YF07_9ACTN|nr:hypothetical protein G7071_07570 [Nocardioides piscis]